MQIPVFSECNNDILISVSLAYVIEILLEVLGGNLASEMSRVRPYSLKNVNIVRFFTC